MTKKTASPTEKCAMAAEISVMANPAYANSRILIGRPGISSARTPSTLAVVSSIRK